jgi:uncharacterized protein (TIGR01777 family)
MKILVTGATGFIGKKLCQKLIDEKHSLVVVSRSAEKAKKTFPFPVDVIEADLNKTDLPQEKLEGVEAVFHLMGESVGEGRWTKAKKKRILDSRVNGTKHLMSSLEKMAQKPKVVISASAIGYYGDRGNEVIGEESKMGEGFLPDVCEAWEQELYKHEAHFDRLVSLRIGIVLGLGGGALTKLLPIFSLGVGGPVGNGQQWMSWVHVDDIVGLFVHSLNNPEVSGPINGTAPKPVTNKEFSKTLGKALHRPAFMPAPGFALKIALGEMSDLVLNSQKVMPKKALDTGYEFLYSELKPALDQIVAEKKTLKTA